MTSRLHRALLATTLLILPATLCALASTASADTLILRDGRIVDGRTIDEKEGYYVIHFELGEVEVPQIMVADYFKDGGEEAYEPQTEEQKKRWEKGQVPWKGRWVSKTRRKSLLKKERKAHKLRIEQVAERRHWRNHATVETKNFVFKHMLSDERFEGFKALFETYYSVFTKEWKIRPDRKFGKPTINIYQDKETFLQVGGVQAGVAGYYAPATRDLNIYYDRQRERFTIDVMFHEGNHMLTHMIDEHVWYPAWVNEGMAEYYGASEWDPIEEVMTVGGLQSARLAVLWAQIEDEQHQELEPLIRMPRIGAIQYAWAWSLCHFLMSSPKYEKGFRKFFTALGRGRKVDRDLMAGGGRTRVIPADEQIKHLKKYLKIKDLDQLEREWWDYIDEQLKLEGDDIDWEGAGWIMDIYGERKKARVFFKRAIQAGSTSAFVFFGYADLQYQRGKPKVALKYAPRALELDPLHGRARFLIGKSKFSTGAEEEGLEIMKFAVEIEPDDPMMLFELEQMKATREKKLREAGGAE